MLKLGHILRQTRNTWEIFKCDALEGWRGSVGPIVWEMNKSYKESGGEEHPTYSKGKKANWIGHILRRNRLLKHVIEAKIERTGRRRRRRKQLLGDLKKLRRYWSLKKGSTSSFWMRQSLWKRLWTCLKTDYPKARRRERRKKVRNKEWRNDWIKWMNGWMTEWMNKTYNSPLIRSQNLWLVLHVL